MSTVSIADAGIASDAVVTRTRLRLTTRGRRLLAGVAAIPAALVVAAAVIGGGAAIGASEGAVAAGDLDSVTVMPGESLWSIAERIAPRADPRVVVDEIAALNDIDGAGVAAGQSLSLPVAYSTGG